MTEYLYEPSEWGKKFHDTPGGREGIREVMGAGAAGPGKSFVLLMDALEQILIEQERCSDRKHPFYQPEGMSTGWALHLRRTRPMLDQTIARSQRIFKAIDPGAEYKSSNTTWVFSSGYRYQFGHCLHTSDWQLYMSNEYTWIGFDELTQFDKEQYDQITGRLRTADPVLRNMIKVRSCTNPVQRAEDSANIKVKDPHWVRKYFVEPAPEGKTILKKKFKRRDGTVGYHKRLYLPATLYDNPDPEFIAQYEETLLGKPDHIKKALLYGDWWVTAGAYYGDSWNDKIHVCKPFQIPADWPIFRSMDWGHKNPGCVLWWAFDPDDNLYCFRELTFKGKNATEVAQMIRQIEIDEGLWRSGRSTISGPADTQLWQRIGTSAMGMDEEMALVGVGWEKADKGPGSRMRNAQLFLKRLNDHHNGHMVPGIVFFEGCRMCRQTIPGIGTNPNNPEEPADGGDDHWHDGVLYACAKASRGRLAVHMLGEKDEWADEIEDDTVGRGRDGYGSTV